MELKTPLYESHIKLGGKIVPFAGYLLPVQYPTGVIAEHKATRTAAGLFDVSHMGEVTYKGPDALKNLNMLLANDFSNMYDGQARYSPMLYENGGFVDDLIVYKKAENDYMVVVNASNRLKDVEWMKSHLFGDVEFEDISDSIAQIAIQGPASRDIIAELAEDALIPKKYYSAVFNSMVGGIPCILSRTGYTGEFGYEIYMSKEYAVNMWELLLNAGEKYGLIPCGLGARDTLRLEAAMPLYGHEMDENTNPFEAELGFAVKMNKPDFVGKSALENISLSKRRVGIKVIDRGIVREHQDIYCGDKLVGKTTSGTFCPFLESALAMAMVNIPYTNIGTVLEVDVRGRRVPVKVVSLPFYKK